MANEQVYYSALHWAKKAEASAKLAADLAQTEGKVIQLGFDGVMEDGQLVFKHAPGGVEVPYHLVDDVEYELDLAYNGDLDSLTTMVVKNGADNITFVSALHRSSTEPARVADMDAVMRHDTTTGYRWLFKATFKIAPNGAKVFLLYPVVAAKDYSDKTNCITEIPQDIKLELKDGVLTLAQGCKGYMGDGTVRTTTGTPTLKNTGSAQMFLHITSGGTGLYAGYMTGGTVSERPSSPINYASYYNTSTQKCEYYDGSTWLEVSLPIAIVTRGAEGFTSIDQVFNGFGYIGSTMWVNKGVKGLIPNGRNADGSLRNIEYVTPKFIIREAGLHTNAPLVCLLKGDYFYIDYTTDIVYNAEQNLIYKKGDVDQILPFATYYSGDTILNFSPKTTFHAVDRNDSSWVAAQGMPSSKYIDLTLGASGTIYTAIANGWFVLSKKSSDNNQLASMITSAGIRTIFISNGSSQDAYLYVPARKNTTLQVFYNLGGATEMFRFYYCEGEN